MLIKGFAQGTWWVSGKVRTQILISPQLSPVLLFPYWYLLQGDLYSELYFTGFWIQPQEGHHRIRMGWRAGLKGAVEWPEGHGWLKERWKGQCFSSLRSCHLQNTWWEEGSPGSDEVFWKKWAFLDFASWSAETRAGPRGDMAGGWGWQD